MKSRREGWGWPGDMIETYKYIHGLYSVNNSLLKIGAETVTRGHKYKKKERKRKEKKLRCCTSPRKKKKKKKPSDSWTAGTRCHLSDVADAPSPLALKSRLDEIWQHKKSLHSLSLPTHAVTSVFES